MHYRLFVVTVALILALVMTSGCTGLLMGNLKAEISDSSDITIPLPLSSFLSVLASQNTTLPGVSAFHVKSSTAGPMEINTDGITPSSVPSPQAVEPGTPTRAAPGMSVAPLAGTASCSPVAGANVSVILVGTPYKTHIAECTTQENGDFSFDVPLPTEIPANTMYTFNFKITVPGYNLPAGASNVVTDMANVSDGPQYTFNVCYQQPSEPNAMAVTRGGIAVFGRISS